VAPLSRPWLTGAALALALAVPAGAARADEGDAATPPRKRNAVQADLGLAVIGLGYERVVGDHVSLQPSLHIFGTWFGPIVDEPRFAGFGGQLRASFFPLGEAPTGLYVAPFVRAERVSTEASGVSGSTVGWSAGAFVGWSFALGERWNIRLGAGAQYMRYVARVAGARVAFDTPFPAIDAIVGYRF
jgi:hypothetical protein